MRSVSHFAGAAVVALALAACASRGPDFERPAVNPAAGYGPTTIGIAGAKVAADWTKLFHSTAIDGLVAEAMAGNPDFESARLRLVAAQSELAAAQGTALPQLSADAGIARGRINGSFLFAPVNEITATGNRFNIGPSLAYNLDLFGGLRRSIEGDAAAVDVARDQARDAYVTLIGRVVVTAFQEAAVDRQIEVTRTLMKDLRDQLDLTRKLEAAGKITHADALQNESQLENIGATLPALEHQREVYRHALARLVGKTPAEFSMPTLSITDFTLPPELPVSLPSELVRQRPDIMAAEDVMHEASARIGVAEAARLPNIVLSGNLAQQASQISQMVTAPATIYTLGLDISGPLFDGGTLKAHADTARVNYTQTQAAYRSAVVGAFVEVADALDALGHDGEGYAAHQRALAASGANRDLAVAQYRAGKVDQLQVFVAEQQYQAAALSEVQADIQRFTDVAELFRSLGGGWWNATPDPALLPNAAG